MTKQKELEQLETIKNILEAYFDDMPEIEIEQDNHYYMTAGWAFILTFEDNGLLLLFDENINPLLSAKMTQLLAANDIQFEIGSNYYYSPYDQNVYFGEDINLRKLIDKEKFVLQSKQVRTRQ
jgi:hypothetical protein